MWEATSIKTVTEKADTVERRQPAEPEAKGMTASTLAARRERMDPQATAARVATAEIRVSDKALVSGVRHRCRRGGRSSYAESSATIVHFYAGWIRSHIGGLVVFSW